MSFVHANLEFGFNWRGVRGGFFTSSPHIQFPEKIIVFVVDPARQQNWDRVYFSASVVYRNGRDEEKIVRIVGIDEARLEHNEVSWILPIARELLKAEEGEIVEVWTSQGVERIEVVEIAY